MSSQLQELIAARRADDPTRYSYGEIARRGALPRSTVYSLATRPAGHKKPTAATLRLLAVGLEVPVDRVFAAAQIDAGYSVEGLTVETRDQREIDAIVVALHELSPHDLRRVQRIVRDFVDDE